MWWSISSHRHAALATGICLLFSVFLGHADAQVMQSGSYQIQSDSINVGGVYSSSTNYQLEDTAGEIATGISSSTNYIVSAGYQQTVSAFLSLSGAADITMSPSIDGDTGGTANGSTTVTAITDSPAGYQLSIKSSANPSMQSGANTIADYSTAGVDPDFTFTTGAGDAHLGFSPEGSDIPDRFKDNGASCNTGSGDTTLSCWDGLSTTNATIASASSSNSPTGATTTVQFRIGIGASASQAAGTYVATTTLTLIAL